MAGRALDVGHAYGLYLLGKMCSLVPTSKALSKPPHKVARENTINFSTQNSLDAIDSLFQINEDKHNNPDVMLSVSGKWSDLTCASCIA